jgi:hypothetical protein
MPQPNSVTVVRHAGIAVDSIGIEPFENNGFGFLFCKIFLQAKVLWEINHAAAAILLAGWPG